MPPIRIHALAKKLDTTSSELLAFLKEIGIEPKTQLSSLSEDEEKQTVEAWKKKKEKPAHFVQPIDASQLRSGRKTGEKVPVILDTKKPAEPSVKTAAPASEPVKEPEKEIEIPFEKQPESIEEPVLPAGEPVVVKTKVPEEVRPEKKPATKPETEPAVLSEKQPETVATSPEKPVAEIVSVQEDEKKLEVVGDSSDAEKPPETPAAGKPILKTVPTLPAPLGHIDLSELEERTDLRRDRRGKKRSKGKDKDKGKDPQDGKKSDGKRGDSQPNKKAQQGSDRKQRQQPKTPVAMGFTEKGYAANTRGETYRGPMRDLLDRKKDGSDRDGGRGGKTGGPKIHLATVPKAKLPTPQVGKEPAAMKPVMKLTEEMRKAAAAGNIDKVESLIKAVTDDQQRTKDKKEDKDKVGGKDKKKKGKDKGQKTVPDDTTVVDTPVRKGKKGGFVETEVPLADKRRRRGSDRSRNRQDGDNDGEMLANKLHRQKIRGKSVNTAAERKTDIVLQPPCTVKQFSESTGVAVAVLLPKLMGLGIKGLNINAMLDKDAVELLAAELNLSLAIRDQVTLEDQLAEDVFEQEDPPETLKPRPPVVTVLGHVDHGKTTLLDKILNLNVVSGEKGGITQHIRAYRVNMENGSDITFVDTPGHEAFTEMRARGANCTDIVILVIAVDDGIMPQTEEAISHAKAAGVPIIVAITKIDLPGNKDDKVQRILQDLAARELTPSEWGGDVEIIRCSGLTGQGVDELLSMIQLVAELHNLRANPDRAAVGVALEASLQAGKGVVCKVLIQKGTLRPGDVVLCGTAYGRVRIMQDSMNPRILVKEAMPGTPVNLIGLDVVPDAGSVFCVVDDISKARVIAEQRIDTARNSGLGDLRAHVTLETLYQRLSDAQTVQTLNIIVRADVRGSIEAIKKELGKLAHPEVKVKILQATVGGITEADVQLADASDAIIVGFNVVPDEKARILADKKRIQIRRYDIIYDLANDIRTALQGMLKPMEQVKELGRAIVQRVFDITRIGSIAGCRVISGNIERDSKMRVIRESRIIGEYSLDSLKREKDDVREVREGYECGIKLRNFNDLKEGDILEAYKIEEVARTF